MRIIFTGASSFTGYWFVNSLVESGHEVFAVLRNNYNEYTGIKKKRLSLLKNRVSLIEKTEFGSEDFFYKIKEMGNVDLFCHHAAEVADYKNPNFNFIRALELNTKNIISLLQTLNQIYCQRVILTGSVFEQNEGVGSCNQAFSPYGLSKGLTFQVFEHFSAKFSISLSKFVIPNPFGPYEEPRFTNYLAKSWSEGKVPEINTPDYIRDNIPVDLMAKVYLHLCKHSEINKINPSGYIESQGVFAQRFAKEFSVRSNKEFLIKIKKQTEYSEPIIRINTFPSIQNVDWNECSFWDQLYAYYKETYNI